MIVGSGNVGHNLHRIAWDRPAGADCPDPVGAGAATSLPAPDVTPPGQSNI